MLICYYSFQGIRAEFPILEGRGKEKEGNTYLNVLILPLDGKHVERKGKGVSCNS